MIRSEHISRLLAAATLMMATFGGSNALAQAKCDLTMATQSQWVIEYDPFGDAQNVGDFDINLSNSGHTPCVGRLMVEGLPADLPLLENRDGGGTIAYTLVDLLSSNDISPGRHGGHRGKPDQTFSDGQSIARVRFAIAPDTSVTAGTYTQQVAVYVRMPNGTIHASTTVTLVVRVKPTLVIGLAGQFTRSNKSAIISLGDLTRDGVVPLQTQVYVRSTIPYQVMVSSRNQGRLVHTNPDWNLPYSLKMGPYAINLQGGDSVRDTVRGYRTDHYPLQFSVSDIERKLAGRYGDVISFTVQPI